MVPQELRDILRQQPFEPFRLVMSDGIGYEIRHPDLLWVGQQSAMVGQLHGVGNPRYGNPWLRLNPHSPTRQPMANRNMLHWCQSG